MSSNREEEKYPRSSSQKESSYISSSKSHFTSSNNNMNFSYEERMLSESEDPQINSNYQREIPQSEIRRNRTTNDMGNIRYYSQEFQRNLEETDLNVFTDTFNLFLKYGTSAVKTFAGPAIDAFRGAFSIPVEDNQQNRSFHADLQTAMNNSMNTYREEKHFSEILEKSRLFPNSALPISQQLNEENRDSQDNSFNKVRSRLSQLSLNGSQHMSPPSPIPHNNSGVSLSSEEKKEMNMEQYRQFYFKVTGKTIPRNAKNRNRFPLALRLKEKDVINELRGLGNCILPPNLKICVQYEEQDIDLMNYLLSEIFPTATEYLEIKGNDSNVYGQIDGYLENLLQAFEKVYRKFTMENVGMSIPQFFALMQQASHIPIIKLVLKMDITQIKEEPKEEAKEYDPFDEDSDSDNASLSKLDKNLFEFKGDNYNIQTLSIMGINEDNSPWNQKDIQFIIEAISRSQIQDNLKILFIKCEDNCKDQLKAFAESKGLEGIKIFTSLSDIEYREEARKLLKSIK